MFPSGVVEDTPIALNDCVAVQVFAVVVDSAYVLRLESDVFTLVLNVSRVSLVAVLKTLVAPSRAPEEFKDTMICDLGCFTQDGKDSNKFYHASVVQSNKNQKWFTYFEWGRTGATNPQFQFGECASKEDAQREYVKQVESKNSKRGEWVSHPSLGKILQAKAGKDCYLVRPQSTRSTGLPNALKFPFLSTDMPGSLFSKSSTEAFLSVRKLSARNSIVSPLNLIFAITFFTITSFR